MIGYPEPVVITRLTGRPRRIRCKRCNGHVADLGALSSRGLCAGCSTSAVIQCAIDLRAKRGRHFDSWLAGLAGYVGRELGAEVDREPVA